MRNRLWPLAVILALATNAMAMEDGELTDPMGGPKATPTNPPPFDMVIFVNGFRTDDETAKRYTNALADKIGCPVRLCFNDLTNPVIDAFSEAIEKAGGADSSVNEATDTLIRVIKSQVEKGKQIHLIGHSGGTLCIKNAVNAVAQCYSKLAKGEKSARLSRIHVLTIGSAAYELGGDGWPDVGSIFNLTCRADNVVNLFGEGSFSNLADGDFDEHHGMNFYIDHVSTDALVKSGKLELPG